ncbi:hypothetical protein [Flindersiella endophytica]
MSGRATAQWSGRRKAALIVIAIVLLALLAAPVVGLITSRGADNGLRLAGDLPQAERTERERTVATHVERAQNALQGSSGGQLQCAAQELAEGPVPNVQGQTRVYAWIVCRTTSADPSATSMPLSVDLGGPDGPVVSFLPEEGAGYAPSIRQHFPQRLHDTVLKQEGIDLERLTQELEQR